MDLRVGDRIVLTIDDVRVGSWVFRKGLRGTITGAPRTWVDGTRGRSDAEWHVTFDARGVVDPTYWCHTAYMRPLDVIEVLAEVERRHGESR